MGGRFPQNKFYIIESFRIYGDIRERRRGAGDDLNCLFNTVDNKIIESQTEEQEVGVKWIKFSFRGKLIPLSFIIYVVSSYYSVFTI